MTDRQPEDVYVAAGFEVAMHSPKLRAADRAEAEVWHVYARFTAQDKGATDYTTDLFVFNADTGALSDVILGVQYKGLAKAAVAEMLIAGGTKTDSLARDRAPAAVTSASFSPSATVANTAHVQPERKSKRANKQKQQSEKKEAAAAEVETETKPGRREMTEEVRNLVVNISGIEADELGLDTEMADVGIDSLMGIELAREVERAFGCTLDHIKQLEATSLRKFVALVEHAMFEADVPRASAVSDVESLDENNSIDGSLVVVEEDPSLSSDDDSDDVQLPPPSETRAPRTMTTTAQATAPATSNLSLSPSVVLDSFAEIKMAADRLLREYEIAGTEKTVMAGNNRLCTALIVEALDELGYNLRAAKAGQPVERISFVPKQSRLMQWIWEFLERDARLVDIDAAHGKLTRTHMTVPSKTSDAILDEQLKQYPKFATPSRLVHFAGKKVAGVLSGKTDGLRVLFGSPEGRELMESHECDQPWNRMHYTQIRDVIKGIAERARLGAQQETLKVLEMGAGVGAITQVLAPFLASLGVPVEFIVTDPSSTLVAGARRRWGEQYPFMHFAVHDLKKAPAAKLQGQHILVGSAVHATRSLLDTLVHMRRALRPNGALLMLKITEGVPFANLVFGSLER
ncbi:hypothetical protein MMC17_008382 [Xylographa soralifera]|nr:hypothetical protein [Xylographa soralifera]